MSLRDDLEQVRSGLQTFEDYGLSEQIDFSTEIRPGAQAVLQASVKLIDTSELYMRAYLLCSTPESALAIRRWRSCC